ncbi:MAG: UbiH/UbiF family hydroxylase [Rhodobacteraceae bacterium]|jgi:2-octaprenyl-6-methoxyphenol hydroxylase|nr:UbiH/UbiF family hydroxylase [Paracoccaceae bacterium]
MTATETDILISGGGVAGLAAAAALGAAGFGVLCVDPAPPVTDAADPAADLRTTAFLQPSVAVLEAAGLWARLVPHAAPLWTMRIVDAAGPGGAVRSRRDFEAADIGDRPFGWNLPNWLLRREMTARIAELPGVRFRPGVATASVRTRTGAALATLSDGTAVRARLLVAADGRDSPVRRALGIGARTIRFGQRALVFAVTHPVPHAGVSTEIHRDGGPFTLVPLPDRDGLPASAVVWMLAADAARRMAALPPAAFAEAITDRSAGLFGALAPVTRVSSWPMIARLADRMAAERTALMAEAAHVVPPIGAQGLNMSLADLRLLCELATADPAGLGARPMLDAYHRRRWPEVAARVAGIDLLNRVSMAGAPPATALRARGIGLLHDIAPLRRAVMRLGLGAGG